jgi:hypothetical protein
MSGIGCPRNRLIVVEILRSASVHGDGTESHVFFNGRIREVKDATERQRVNFYKKQGKFSDTTNTDLNHLLAGLVNTLNDPLYIHSINVKVKGRK